MRNGPERGDILTAFHAAELSPVSAMIISAVIGFAYALMLLGPGVSLGTSDFWEWPTGIQGGALDIRLALSGYYWLAQDIWRWPLLDIPYANWPQGTNAGLMEIIPIASLLGKVFYGLTGTLFNFFPLWLSGSYALNAAALNSLVRSLGVRTLLATVLSSSIGAMSPIIHFRFGHVAHSSHWIFVFALALCVMRRSNVGASAWRRFALVALALLAACVNLYLFVMTAAIVAAALLEAAWRREIGLLKLIGYFVVLLASGLVPQWAFGLLQSPGIGSNTIEFGRDSMNLLSPFWPQTSGAFSWTGFYWLTRGSIGATKGQYEGYSYVGLGSLLLIVIAIVRTRWATWELVRQNWILTAVMAVLTLWALSNHIYVGPYLLATIPLPDFLTHTVLAWFRSGGRFFWPVAWLVVGLGIAGTLSRLSPRAALAAALVAMALQWIDLSLWRAKIAAIVSAPAVSALGPEDTVDDLRKSLATYHLVTVTPEIFCSSSAVDYSAVQNIGAMDVQLLAARVNARMTSAFVSRGQPPCDKGDRSLKALAGNGLLIVLADPGSNDRIAEARALLSCRSLEIGVACLNR